MGDTDNSTEKEEEKREKNGNVDLEAGERVIDDAGMDIGDMSSRDYGTDKKEGGDDNEKEGKRVSPTNSEDTFAGSYKGKERASSPSGSGSGSGSASTDDNDHRAEKHYREKNADFQDTWQEGGDTVIESKDGEDIVVMHRDGSRDERDYTTDGLNHHSGAAGGSGSARHAKESSTEEGGGGGFPEDASRRMQEIADMISRGHHMSHKAHKKASADDLAAKTSGKKSRSDEDASKRRLEDAAERVAREDSRAQQQQQQYDSEHGEDEDHGDSVGPMRSEQPAPPNVRPGLISSMESFINRPKHTRKSTLTAEEKYARDAWCRKERKDVDDDEVRAWVSGKHIVIERNNGEDVEVVDANPNKEAREQARKNPDLKLRAVDQDRIAKAKKEIAADEDGEQRGGPQSSAAGASGPQHGKRFDLKAIRNNQSFRKLFGGHGDDSSAATSLAARDTSSSSSTNKNISFASNVDNRSERETRPTAESSTPNYLSTRGKGTSTGISLDRTDTTDSQVRFGHLPVGRRK